MLINQYRGAGGLAVILGLVGTLAVSACGDAFTSCKETRTCRPAGGAASVGGATTLDAGAGGMTSESGATTGGDTSGVDSQGGQLQGGAAAVGGAGGETMTEGGGAPSVVTPDDMGEACSDDGTLRCVGPAQKVSQLCDAGKWVAATICKSDENCDQTTGTCAPIVAACAGKIGGQLYCGPDDKIFACGPDLVSTAEAEECTGKCTESEASASCAPVTCGDGKLQAPEACDDGNQIQTDACTNACKNATCGDGSIWKDHEACDDGNAMNDDACSATCKVSTCGDGYVWIGKETCDDKNKVDTDACTNACKKAACGDGIVQAGKEECDDKNATSGDGCSKTCTVDAPPVGLFAWYKAVKDDVVLTTATLADGNEFNKSGWVKSDLTAEASQPDVDGGNTATAIKNQVAGKEPWMKHALVASSRTTLTTLRIRARMGERRYVWLSGPPSVANTAEPFAVFDLLDGVVSHQYASTAAITDLGNSWYLCEVTLLIGPEIWVGVSNSATSKGAGGPVLNKPLAWIQRAEVEQSYVTVWRDRVGARDLTNSNGGWRWLNAATEFSGTPALESYYLYNPQLAAGEAADWQFLHDGSGATVIVLQQQPSPTAAYRGTLGTEYDGSAQGMRMGVSSQNSKTWAYSATNGNGESVFEISAGSTVGTRWLAGSYAASQAPAAQLWVDGVMGASAAAAASPSMQPPAAAFRLGAATGTPFQKIAEVIVYKRALAAADMAQLDLYFAPRLPTN